MEDIIPELVLEGQQEYVRMVRKRVQIERRTKCRILARELGGLEKSEGMKESAVLGGFGACRCRWARAAASRPAELQQTFNLEPLSFDWCAFPSIFHLLSTNAFGSYPLGLQTMIRT